MTNASMNIKCSCNEKRLNNPNGQYSSDVTVNINMNFYCTCMCK